MAVNWGQTPRLRRAVRGLWMTDVPSMRMSPESGTTSPPKITLGKSRKCELLKYTHESYWMLSSFRLHSAQEAQTPYFGRRQGQHHRQLYFRGMSSWHQEHGVTHLSSSSRRLLRTHHSFHNQPSRSSRLMSACVFLRCVVILIQNRPKQGLQGGQKRIRKDTVSDLRNAGWNPESSQLQFHCHCREEKTYWSIRGLLEPERKLLIKHVVG